MSASKLRKAVQDNDFEAFSKGVTKAAQPMLKKCMTTWSSTILGSKEEQIDKYF